MAGGENLHTHNNTYDDGADGLYDDGPFTPLWSEEPPAGNSKGDGQATPNSLGKGAPVPPASTWDSLSDVKKYNEAHADDMYREWQISQGLDPDADDVPGDASPTNDNDALHDNWIAQQKGYADHDEYLAEKNKWVGRGWAKTVHWYKENPDEISEILPADSEHDVFWYQNHPEAIGDLVRDHFKTQSAELTPASGATSTQAAPAPISAKPNKVDATGALSSAAPQPANPASPPLGASAQPKPQPTTPPSNPLKKLFQPKRPNAKSFEELAAEYLQYTGADSASATSQAQKIANVQSPAERAKLLNEKRYHELEAERAKLLAEKRAELVEQEFIKVSTRQQEIVARQAAINRELEKLGWQSQTPQKKKWRERLRIKDRRRTPDKDNLANKAKKDDASGEIIDKQLEADRKAQLEALDRRLHKLVHGVKDPDSGKKIPGLAELYARNRRLIVGAKNRAEFVKRLDTYEKCLNEYLELRAKMSFESSRDRADKAYTQAYQDAKQDAIAKMIAFKKSGHHTDAEINAELERVISENNRALDAIFEKQDAKIKAGVSAELLDGYLKQRKSLKSATIDALDNGTACRKIVSKVIDTKGFKIALGVAGAAGLAVTGAGLATGAVAATVSYTAGGVTLGAGKGAASGLLMSRQSSKRSAINKFASKKTDVDRQIDEAIQVKDGKSRIDVANVGNYLTRQYQKSSQVDRSSNFKRTLPAALAGAAIGGATSGIHLDKVVHGTTEKKQITGYTPNEYQTKINEVDVPEGAGLQEVYRQLGGDPSKFDEAYKVATSIDAKYGLVPGSNGEVAGENGLVGVVAHTYPGRIDTWPDIARAYITEVQNAWAAGNYIQATNVGHVPIYGTFTEATTTYIRDGFHSLLAHTVNPVLTSGAVAGAIASPENRVK